MSLSLETIQMNDKQMIANSLQRIMCFIPCYTNYASVDTVNNLGTIANIIKLYYVIMDTAIACEYMCMYLPPF